MMGLGGLGQLLNRSLDHLPDQERLRRLEERVQRLEIRTLLLAVIGIQTTMVLLLLMIIVSLVT
ncbi:MAG: hypothetical protein V9G98_22635 [Candidatus Competibacter sp.]